MSKILKTFFVFVVLLTCSLGTPQFSGATDPNNQGNINTQEVKEDYRLFLQKLKQLNSQYKQITGEITKVMKEEGVPSWQTEEPIVEETVLDSEPGVVIKENASDMTVAMNLPGVNRDSIKIVIQDNKKLNISAQKKNQTPAKTIHKSIELPSAVEPNGAKATYRDGVLMLKIQKIASKEVAIPLK